MPVLLFKKIAVLGAGSWGTALAAWLAARAPVITLWGHDPAHIEQLRSTGRNDKYLPGIDLPKGIAFTSDLADVVGSDLTIFVTPSRALREVAGRLGAVPLAPGAILLSCTKGIEGGSGLRMSEILSGMLPGSEVAVLSGPSHAEEVVRGGPTALVIGAENAGNGERLQALFNAVNLRAYTSDDCAGVELGGALKNIYAIAAGISDGLGFGDNAKAALVTRSLVELARLGSRLGGRRETFQGLSGIGDLMVTCFSRHSRNRSVGERLGRGESLAAITGSMAMIAEGLPTTRSAHALARQLQVDTPVIDQVHAILYEGRLPADGLNALFTREPRPERDQPPP